MTQPFNPAGDGLPAGPAPGATAAGSRAAGGTGPGVPLSIWPGLPDPGGTRDGLPCGGPVTVAAARRVIDAFSLPGNLVAAAGGSAGGHRGGGSRRPARPRPRPRACPGPAPARWPGGAAAARRPRRRDGRAWPSPAAAASGRAASPRKTPGRCSPPASGCCAPAGCWRSSPAPPPPAARPPAPPGASSPPPAPPGLVYAQHIVLVRAGIDGDRLAPAAPGTGSAAPGGSPVHDDLLVFTKPGGGARS